MKAMLSGRITGRSWLAISLFFMVLLAGCSGGSSSSTNSSARGGAVAVTLTGINITPTAATVLPAQIATLSATGIYSDGTTADITNQVTWSSSNTAGATVSNLGVVTGNTTAGANITASMSGVTSSTVPVTVTQATMSSLSVSPGTITIPVGQTTTLTATAGYIGGTTGNVSGSVSWLSSNTAVATVNASGVVTTIGVGTATISASMQGSVASSTLNVTAPPNGPMAGTNWTYSGTTTAPWVSVVDATVPNGGSVYRAANITDSQNTRASFSVTNLPAGNITFYYKVSSEQGWDFLNFYIDGVLQNSWSGAVPWTLASFPVLAGNHTFMWEYSKDVIWSAGSDTAWVSQVTLPVAVAVPVSLTITPGTASVTAGQTINLTATAGYSDGTTLDVTNSAAWSSNNMAVATTPGSGVINTVAAGTATISASFGGFGASSTLNVTTAGTGTGPMAGTWIYGGMTWATGLPLTTPWSQVVDNTVPNLGAVYQAATITHGDNTTATINVTAVNPGNVTFYYKVDSEPSFDFLTFAIDGVVVGSWSGFVPWTLASYPITPGAHTLTWMYYKDTSVNWGADTAWVSQVVVP